MDGLGMTEVLYEVARRWPGTPNDLVVSNLPEAALEWLLSDEAKAYGPKLLAAQAAAREDMAKMHKTHWKSRLRRWRLVERWFRQVMVNAYMRMTPIRTD